MRQTHVAGERLFIDYAGQTVPIIDASSGAITLTRIFVAALGASNYTYACATLRQSSADWEMSAIRLPAEKVSAVVISRCRVSSPTRDSFQQPRDLRAGSRRCLRARTGRF